MPLLDILTIYVLMLAVMVLLGALKALYTAKALGRNRVEVAVNERVPSRPTRPTVWPRPLNTREAQRNGRQPDFG